MKTNVIIVSLIVAVVVGGFCSANLADGESKPDVDRSAKVEWLLDLSMYQQHCDTRRISGSWPSGDDWIILRINAGGKFIQLGVTPSGELYQYVAGLKPEIVQLKNFDAAGLFGKAREVFKNRSEISGRCAVPQFEMHTSLTQTLTILVDGHLACIVFERGNPGDCDKRFSEIASAIFGETKL